MRYAIYMMIGPGEAEGRRLLTVLRSLFRHEPATPLLVLVNDSRGPLPTLDATVPAGCEVLSLTSLPGHGTGHSRNILQALRTLAARDDWAFAMKLDTDALVIGPFAAKIATYFEDHPNVGQLGQAGIDCDGNPIDYGFYKKYARRLTWPLQIWRRPHWSVRQAIFGRTAKVRRLVKLAAAHGVRDGRHCQGGAYAISRAAVARLDAGHLLNNDPAGIVLHSTDDIMLSTLVAAAGLDLASLTATNEPFALLPIGLPMAPAELAARGYSIIHSVKNDARVSEAEVVRFFEARDAAANTGTLSPARA